MTFNAFVKHILDNTLPFDIYSYEKKTINYMFDNAQHLKYYSTDDFLEIYMEYFDIQENGLLSNYDEAIEMNADYMDQADLEKWLDIDDMVKDTKTFGYSDFMYNMSYDAW